MRCLPDINILAFGFGAYTCFSKLCVLLRCLPGIYFAMHASTEWSSVAKAEAKALRNQTIRVVGLGFRVWANNI